jgi:hypothetical protein
MAERFPGTTLRLAYHEQYWTITGWPEGEPIASIAVQDRWPVDMRGW